MAEISTIFTLGSKRWHQVVCPHRKTSGSEQLQQETDSLEKAYTLQSQRVDRIRNTWVIETDPSCKFQSEHQVLWLAIDKDLEFIKAKLRQQ